MQLLHVPRIVTSPWQLFSATARPAQRAGLPKPSYTRCLDIRIGPLKWLGSLEFSFRCRSKIWTVAKKGCLDCGYLWQVIGQKSAGRPLGGASDSEGSPFCKTALPIFKHVPVASKEMLLEGDIQREAAHAPLPRSE